jgi:hypothetical protein
MGPRLAAWVVCAIVATGAVAGLAATGCRGRSAAPEAAPPDESGRFPHAAHALACAECHDPRAVAAGTVRAPGGDDHAPCDRGECHGDAFLRAPGLLCEVCHTAVDGTRTGASPLVDYPRRDAWRALPVGFSHAVHGDFARMEAAVGFHVTCTDCHAAGDGAYPRNPGHAECGRCHADEVQLPGAPTLSSCDACHQPGHALRHPRALIDGDLRFDHRRHLADLRGQRIGCETCHQGTRAADSRASDPPPPIAVCVACHDDDRRVPSQRNMRVCETCHANEKESLIALAPRSHLPASERPANHTLAFRRDHAEIAARDGATCARCHTQLSGSPVATCDECHQTQRPSDHTVAFRDVDHGTESGTSPDRCATCHVADFCTACHSQPPRSHQPLGSFALREHGDQARLQLRACVVCHDPVDDCGRCHIGAGGLQ